MIAYDRPEQLSRCRAACLYRLDRLFFREKLIIARSSIVAAKGCLPASNFDAGNQHLVVILVDVVRAFEHQVCGSVESRLNEKLPTRPSAL